MATADSAIRFNLFAKDQTGPGIRSADSNFSKFGKGLVTKFAAAGAAIGGISLLGDFISEAQESAKVGRLTENVIKSTGGAAKITADQVGNLATKLSNKTAVDDEVIQSGQNLLLTFTGIRNEVGKGNNIFDQASKAALDMAAGLNGGTVTAENLKGTSVQLGKALNDPIKGITALSRSGVSFTEKQKEQIKSMVKAGDTMGAQKLILAELNKEFGGAAAAAADPAQKAQVAWGNLKEQIGTGILPLFNKVATFASDKLIPAVSTGIEKVGPIFSSASKGVSVFFNALSGNSSPGEFEGGLNKINRAGLAVGNWIRNDFLPVAKQLWSWFQTQAIPAVKTFAQNLWTDLQPSIKAITTVFQQNLRPAIETMVAKFKEAWPTIQRVATILGQVAGFILSKVVPVLITFAGKYLQAVIVTFANVFSATWRFIGVLIDVGKAIGEAGAAFGRFVGKVGSAMGSAYNAVKSGGDKAIRWFKDLPGTILATVGDLGSVLYNAGKGIISGLIRGIEDSVPGLKNVLGAVTKLIPIHKGPPSKDKVLLRPAGQAIMGGLVDGMKSQMSKVSDFLDGLTSRLQQQVDAAKDFAQSIRDTFRTATDLTSISTTLTDARGEEFDGGLAAMIAGLQKRVTDAKKFADTVTKLRKAGLNATSLENLRSAGPDGGLTAAQNLLAGGSSAIQQVNQLTKQINQTGRDFANRETKAMYGFTGTGDMSAKQAYVVLDLRSDDKQLLERLRREIRVKGGNVQVVLGKS